jgi:hypothetical protein
MVRSALLLRFSEARSNASTTVQQQQQQPCGSVLTGHEPMTKS